MNRTHKTPIRLAIVFMAFAVTFTSLPLMTGDFTVHAAAPKKPAKVTGLKKQAVGTSYITVQWTMIKKNKNTKGYAIYLNGKLYKRVGVKTNRYKIANLKSNTAYKVQVRAYNSYKQKQYYNSKTKKWVVKKPKKKQWKGKKTRSITKYLYGPYSAALSIKTAAVPKAAQPSTSGSAVSGTTVDNDKWFTNSTLPASETYDLSTSSGYVTYTVNTKGMVTWASSNPSVATVSAPSPGDTCRVTFKGVGTTNITAKSALNGKTKTIKLTIKRSDIGTPQNEDDGGIDTPYGKIYPNADGSFTLKEGTPGYYTDGVRLNGVDVPSSAIYNYLPSGSVIKVSAADGLNDGAASSGPTLEGRIGSGVSSRPSVVYVAKLRSRDDISGMDLWDSGLVFVSAGEATVTFTNGQKIKFIVTGENTSFKGYLNYINSMVSAVASKGNYGKVNYWTREIRKFGYKNYQSAYDVYNYGQGDCWGGNNLLIRLCDEVGIYARLRDAGKESSSGMHRNTHVVIDGIDYIVDATPEDGTVFQTWESYRDGRGLTDNDL